MNLTGLIKNNPSKALGGFLLIFLFVFSIEIIDEFFDWVTLESRPPFYLEIMDEASGSFLGIVMLPLWLWFLSHFRLQRHNWYKNLPFHVLFTFPASALNTTLLDLSDHLLFDEPIDLFNHIITSYDRSLFWYTTFVALTEFFEYFYSNFERERKTLSLEKQLVQAKLDVINMQVQPHFLFNTLNMITSYIRTDTQRAEQMVIKLSELLRKVLDMQAKSTLPLSEELEVLELYLAIVQERFKDRLSIEMKIQDECRNCFIPAMLLQPLVENAIKHGVELHRGKGTLWFGAECDTHVLKLIIKNQNEKELIQKIKNERGIGLASVKERLQTLYEGQAHLEMNPLNNGMEVDVTIPLDQTKPQS